MRFSLVNVIACFWLAAIGCLFLIQPFLAEPTKTYAGHAMYLTFLGGVGAAMIAAKIRTGSFPFLKPVTPPTTSTSADISAASIWITAFLIAGVGAGAALKYNGLVNDRRTHLLVVLCAPAVIIAGYYACRFKWRRPAN